jgi:putative transposase
LKYACITRHRDEFPMRLMCRVLEVARSGYYAWRKRTTPCARQLADERLLLNIRLSYHASDGTYGAPRILDDLRDAGFHVGQKRVRRLMQREGLAARQPKAFVATTDSAHAYPIAPNLVARHFDVDGMALNQVWVSDITYVPTREGWLYLAIVLDLASRRVVGWSMREQVDGELTRQALESAIATRRPPPGLIHHSDRGVQYACTAYRQLLEEHGMQASMSRVGDCWDNAVAESFFATLEFELIARYPWQTRDDARRAIFAYIETWYNRRRRHSTLGNVSPAQYEQHLRMAA